MLCNIDSVQARDTKFVKWSELSILKERFKSNLNLQMMFV